MALNDSIKEVRDLLGNSQHSLVGNEQNNIKTQEEMNMADNKNGQAQSRIAEQVAAKKAEKEAAEEAAKKAAEETKTEETKSEETKAEETQTEETKPEGTKEKTPEELQAEIMAGLNKAKENATKAEETTEGSMEETNEFSNEMDKQNGSSEGGENKEGLELTDDQKKALEKAEALKKANFETMKKNNETLAWKSSLKVDKELTKRTEKQEDYMRICRNTYVNEGFVVLDGPSPAIAVSRKFSVDANGKAELIDESLRAAYEQYLQTTDKSKLTVTNATYQKFTASVTLNYKIPKEILAAVISFPEVLKNTPQDFASGNLETNEEVIKNSDRITLCVDLDTHYAMVALNCDGVINESKAMNADKVDFQRTSKAQAVKTIVTPAKKTVNGVTTEITKKGYKPIGRKQLFVQENIIPVRNYRRELATEISPQTTEALQMLFMTSLKKKKNEPSYIYDKLRPEFKDLFSVSKDEASGTINNIALNFLNKEMLGTGKLRDVVLRHWSKVEEVNGAVVKKQLPLELASYAISIAKKSGAKSKKKLIKYLGVDLSLQDLAEEYPAAKIALEKGVKEEAISEIYNIYAAKKQAETRARSSANTATSVTRKTQRISPELEGRDVQNIMLSQYTGKVDVTDTTALLDYNAAKESFRSLKYSGLAVQE